MVPTVCQRIDRMSPTPTEKYNFYCREGGLELWKEQCYDERPNKTKKDIKIKDVIKDSEGVTYNIGKDIDRWKRVVKKAEEEKKHDDEEYIEKQQWLSDIRKKVIRLTGASEDEIPDVFWQKPSLEEKYEFYVNQGGIDAWKMQCFDKRTGKNQYKKDIQVTDSIICGGIKYNIGGDINNWKTNVKEWKTAEASGNDDQPHFSEKKLESLRKKEYWLGKIRDRLLELGHCDPGEISDPYWVTKNPEEKYRYYIEEGLDTWKRQCFDLRTNKTKKDIQQTDTIVSANGTKYNIGTDINNWKVTVRKDEQGNANKRQWLEVIRERLVRLGHADNEDEIPYPYWKKRNTDN